MLKHVDHDREIVTTRYLGREVQRVRLENVVVNGSVNFGDIRRESFYPVDPRFRQILSQQHSVLSTPATNIHDALGSQLNDSVEDEGNLHGIAGCEHGVLIGHAHDSTKKTGLASRSSVCINNMLDTLIICGPLVVCLVASFYLDFIAGKGPH